ncbi:MAG: component of the polarisome [Watsoniomyces obsoletus]|nr:MAG: component of the polarisome [Watsoniomyces obsoletus]
MHEIEDSFLPKLPGTASGILDMDLEEWQAAFNVPLGKIFYNGIHGPGSAEHVAAAQPVRPSFALGVDRLVETYLPPLVDSTITSIHF